MFYLNTCKLPSCGQLAFFSCQTLSPLVKWRQRFQTLCFSQSLSSIKKKDFKEEIDYVNSVEKLAF
jgi:DNA-binding transcriptional regulator YdaS (Cro superfamily)